MDPSGSVTRYLAQCKAGDPQAAQPVWERYFPRLARLAEKALAGKPWAAFDGEDVALSALDSFFQGLAGGQYPELGDRNELWALLTRIVRHKVLDWVKYARRGKRDVEKVQGGSAGLEHLQSREPDPEEAATAADQVRCLFESLGDDTLREIALLKMEGFTDKEVADRLNCGLRTVERKLERIRRKWEKESTP